MTIKLLVNEYMNIMRTGFLPSELLKIILDKMLLSHKHPGVSLIEVITMVIERTLLGMQYHVFLRQMKPVIVSLSQHGDTAAHQRNSYASCCYFLKFVSHYKSYLVISGFTQQPLHNSSFVRRKGAAF